MFSTQVDVAAIMREIKENIIPETPEMNSGDELQRITEFIQNTRSSSSEHVNIGYLLPACPKYPRLIRKGIIFLLRVIRKISRFIINDQIIVNRNTDACIQALVEREDAIARNVGNDISRLAGEGELLQRKVEQALQMEAKLRELSDKIDQLEENKKLESIITDEMYIKFEEQYRGTTEDICERQQFYINRFLLGKNFEKGDIALDLGCGRGEWLQKVNGLGFSVVGIDTNEKMVEECLKTGMEAKVCDAISYLRKLTDNSISLISAFQVIEHMPKSDVIVLVKEAYRVLKPQGILILETPNICNLEVGASSFYIDPTHINPMHPGFLQFLAEYEGFGAAEITYWKQEGIEEWLLSVMRQEEKDILGSALFRTVFESMKTLIYSSPDYALVATK